MIGLIDNFDSFTYNIVALLDALGEEVVVLNQQTPLELCLEWEVKGWILGPGPGGPEQTGVCRELIGVAPILGICLGHQLIGDHFGASIVKHRPHHGRRSAIVHQGTGLFANIPKGFTAVRYHSLVVEKVREPLEVIAWTEEGVIMGVAHRSLPIWGVQFHPDSIATEYGELLLKNFIDLANAFSEPKIGAEVTIPCKRIVDKLVLSPR